MSYLLSQNLNMEDGRENEYSIDAVNRSNYTELHEITDSHGTYSEINEYAPLNLVTRSWEVSRENVTIEKVIGKGAFGQVAQGTAWNLPLEKGTTTVAVKMLKGILVSTLRPDRFQRTTECFLRAIWHKFQSISGQFKIFLVKFLPNDTINHSTCLLN